MDSDQNVNNDEPMDSERISALPEFQAAAEWRAGVFAFAESIIAEETAHIPDGVLARIDRLIGEGAISADSAALARAWSGVAPGEGARGSVILRLLRSISKAPSEGADLTKWWIAQASDEEDVDRMDLVFAHWSYTGKSEGAPISIAALGECERALMLDAAKRMPGVVDVYDALSVDEQAARVGERLRLGYIADRVNVMRDQARLAGGEGADCDRVSVSDIQWTLGAAERDVYVDCGPIRDAEELRDVMASLRSSGLGFSFCRVCAVPGSVVWIAKQGAPGWADFRHCGGCSVSDERGPQIGVVGAPHGTLMSLSGDVNFDQPEDAIAAIALAIALRCSPADAAELLAERLDRADISGARCPRAAECGKSCGRLQALDEAMPAISSGGDPEACDMKTYLDLADGVEGKAERWAIALPLIKAARGEECVEPKIAAPKGVNADDRQGSLL